MVQALSNPNLEGPCGSPAARPPIEGGKRKGAPDQRRRTVEHETQARPSSRLVFPLGPVEGAELALLGALADSLDGGAGLLAVANGPRRRQARRPGRAIPKRVLRLERAHLTQTILHKLALSCLGYN